MVISSTKIYPYVRARIRLWTLPERRKLSKILSILSN